MADKDAGLRVAQEEMAANREHFNQLRDGQQADQGGENYYLTDAVEVRNFRPFIERLVQASRRIGNKVLVAGCGDGLESEVLAMRDFDLTILDYAPGMLEDARERLRNIGKTAVFEVADVTDLELPKFKTDFAGVTMAQVAQFIPPVEGDVLLAKAITDLASLTPEGVFYLSTTQYEDPHFPRTWTPNGESAGQTRYHSRPAESIVRMIENTGMTVVRHEHFDAGTIPPDDYKNDYFVAARNINC